MKDFIDFSRITAIKRIGFILAFLLFGASAVLVACTEQFVTTDGQGTEESQVADETLGTEASESDVYTLVEVMPRLVGGLKSIQERLRYPQLAKEAGIEGRVLIQFVVDKNGAVQNPVVVRGLGSGLDAAALKAVESARFTPGMQRGEPVNVKISVPITFRLPPPSEEE